MSDPDPGTGTEQSWTPAARARARAHTHRNENRWYRHAVFYEVYPRSFVDSNGDGSGDLPGVTSRLDYLAALGVDAIWLTPFYPSPQIDYGYDISDYEGVASIFGTLEDFDRLLAEAHRRGIRVIIDLVLNHTSDQHPFFRDAITSRESRYRDFYIFRDGVDGGPPNNWTSVFWPSAWTLEPLHGQHYYHAFYPEQPDLNWRNPDVEKAMFGFVRFWLDRGVDGFRLDSLPFLFEDPALRDNPTTSDGEQERRYNTHLPEIHDLLARLRALVDEYPGDRLLVGESYMDRVEDLRAYSTPADRGVQLPFNFFLLKTAGLRASEFRRVVDTLHHALEGRPAAQVLSNHDYPRAIDRWGDGAHNDAIERLLAVLLLTLPGAPCVYYGEEIGMVNTWRTTFDTDWREGQRTPMQWDASPTAGFTTGVPWLAISSNAGERNVERETQDPTSLLSLYRRLIGLRREHAALRSGDYGSFGDAPDVFSYVRSSGDARFMVALNMSTATATLDLDALRPGRAVRLLSTEALATSSESQGSSLCLAPFEAVIVELDAGESSDRR